MKTVTFVVEIVAEINDDTNPDEVTFDMDHNRVYPVVKRYNRFETVGRSVAHETTAHFNNNNQ